MIKMPTGQARHEIEGAAQDAIKTIAKAAEEAAKVVANSAAEAVKVANAKNDGDHDILIVLKTKMEDLKADIKDLKDGTTTQIGDHELRIKKLENKTANYLITLTLYSVFVGGLVGLLLFHIFYTK
jgi:hypothetical protein